MLNREGANYLVVGGRQLGKSSLLKAIDRHYRDDPRVDCRYLVLSDSDLTGGLGQALGLGRDAGLDSVVRSLAEREDRSLLLVDEADAFIRAEGGASSTLARLRSLSEEGRCHFILAGFWDLYATAVLDYQSPLRNFGETLRVGALEADACRDLATSPMATMGLSYASDDLVDRLVAGTGACPYVHGLGRRWTIGAASLLAVDVFHRHEPVTHHVDGDLSLLEDDVAQKRLVISAVALLHLHEGDFVEDLAKTLDLNPDRTAGETLHHLVVGEDELNGLLVGELAEPVLPGHRQHQTGCAGVDEHAAHKRLLAVERIRDLYLRNDSAHFAPRSLWCGIRFPPGQTITSAALDSVGRPAGGRTPRPGSATDGGRPAQRHPPRRGRIPKRGSQGLTR